MTNAELRLLFPFTAPALFADETYSKPTLAWLQGKFWDWFQQSRWKLGLSRWTRKNDCDNFARAYAQAAQDCHSLSQDPKDSEGLAVGEFWYHQDSGGGHAIVVALTDQGLVFIEPQNGGVLTLSDKEISTCFFVRF